jgi:hypothetical protein
MTASNAPQRGQSVSELLYTAVAVFRATLLKCLPFAMVAVLCAQVPSFYWMKTGDGVWPHMLNDPTYLTLGLIGGAVALYIFSAMMLRQVYFSGGFAVNSKQELLLAARRLPSLLMTWMLMQLTLFIGIWLGLQVSRYVALLMIVPAIFLFVCYLVLLPVVMLEGQLNPLLALRRCVTLVLPNWWRVFAAFVIALFVTLIFSIVFGALLQILVTILAGPGAAFDAILAAGSVAMGAAVFVFFSALALAIHSSANSSA